MVCVCHTVVWGGGAGLCQVDKLGVPTSFYAVKPLWLQQCRNDTVTQLQGKGPLCGGPVSASLLLPLQVIKCQPGRGKQMNVGWRASRKADWVGAFSSSSSFPWMRVNCVAEHIHTFAT